MAVDGPKERRTRLPDAVREALNRRQTLPEASKAHEALQESEQRYRTLANSGRALIWTSGPDNQCDYVNQPWLDFTGRTFDQERGGGWADGVHPDDLSQALEACAKAFDRREPFSRVYRLRRHDGEYRSVQDDATPRYDTRGHFLGYIGHGLDITDRLRAEQGRARFEAAFAQAQKMEAVGRLASSVSHDFNNLLTGILGYCDLLLNSMPADSAWSADVTRIQSAAHRASALTRQLLAFSRKQAMSPIQLNLTTLVSDLQKPLRAMLRENIEIVWNLSSGLDEIDGDPGQVEQAIYNLVANAADAMPDGGRLTIRTAEVTLDGEFTAAHPGAHEGRHVALALADTGRGIEPELLPLIFEPFFTTKAAGVGTGLGLAAVYGIVRQCGGCVVVESEPGRGSMFTMYFRVSIAAHVAPSPSPAPSPADARGAETILVVEDEEGLRVLVRRVLERDGYRVLEAVDGLDATARWLDAAGRIDLLLTDIVMPGRNGADVARLFRESSPSLPVVFMSGGTDADVFRDVVVDERTAIVKKPYLPERARPPGPAVAGCSGWREPSRAVTATRAGPIWPLSSKAIRMPTSVGSWSPRTASSCRHATAASNDRAGL
jgi:PAS domain S-box-containing protein